MADSYSRKTNNKIELNKFIKNDVDDFWNDCVNSDANNPSLKIQASDNLEQYITCKIKYLPVNSVSNNPGSDNQAQKKRKDLTSAEPSLYERLSSAPSEARTKNFEVLAHKYHLDNLWTAEELQAKQLEELKKKKSMERCYILYEKGKIKNEVNRIMYHKNEEFKIQHELKNCTWKPTLTKLNKKLEENLKIITKDTKIYNRAIKWKFKNCQKIVRSKSEIQQESLEYTYKPLVYLKLIPRLIQIKIWTTFLTILKRFLKIIVTELLFIAMKRLEMRKKKKANESLLI